MENAPNHYLSYGFSDGTYSYASSVFNDPDFNNINAVINEAQRYKKIKKYISEKMPYLLLCRAFIGQMKWNTV